MTFFRTPPGMSDIGDRIRAQTERFLDDHGIARELYSFVVVCDPAPDRVDAQPEGYALRGDRPTYPCSLVKLFHMVAAECALAEGRIAAHSELDRALGDMIRWSSNTATNYVIDVLTGTTGDTLLDGAALREWVERRTALNRFFLSWDWPEFAGLNLCQKLMDDQRYGRERQLLETTACGHNRLSPLATARLMHRVMSAHVPPLPGRAAMAARLVRDPASDDALRDAYQVRGYLAEGLPHRPPVWSKAGHNRWTGDPDASFFRHDVLWTDLPGGGALLIALFSETEALSERNDFMPYFADLVWHAVRDRETETGASGAP